MALMWIAILHIVGLLPSFILATDTSTDTNWQYQIYVSSSDGTKSSSCWNGFVPCNTLNLALQGVQHNSTVIYLYPGIYTLDDEVQVRNISHVAIIGLSDNVTILCQPLTGQWLQNINLQCLTIESCPTTINTNISCPYCPNTKLNYINVINYYNYYNYVRQFILLKFNTCNNISYASMNRLRACIVSNEYSLYDYSMKICSSNSSCASVEADNSYIYNFTLCNRNKLQSSATVSILIQTLEPLIASTNITIFIPLTISPPRVPPCLINACDTFCYSSSAPCCYYERAQSNCATNRTGRLCGSCKDGYSVPINLPSKCVQCDPLIGWILFVTVQLLPVTVMVLLIIVLNIQLTSGTFNGLVLYSQVLTTLYPGLTSNSIFGTLCSTCPISLYFKCDTCYQHLLLLPLNIFNLDFTLFLNDYPLCISSATTPLGALSFRYVIGLYPLLLLLLLYVWITLYDKGYKVIVLITRPIHHLLARFWHMTNIEPSLPHSIASIYLLCFMQLVATSLKLLHFSIHDGKIAFFYDGSLDYFGWPHSFAGIFAILVLILLVLIPMLYIQLYPFKPFHKLLECLHLNNWQILTSLGDVFTGPYKNRTTNKLEYRYFAGFYLLLRLILLLLYFKQSKTSIYSHNNYSSCTNPLSIIQVCLLILFIGTIMIFRPYKKIVYTFIEFLIFLFLAAVSLLNAIQYYGVSNFTLILAFDCFIFVFVSLYFIYWAVKKIRNCYGYYRIHKPKTSLSSSNDNTTTDFDNDEYSIVAVTSDNDWIADRVENPQNYDEQHIPVAPYQLYPIIDKDEAND